METRPQIIDLTPSSESGQRVYRADGRTPARGLAPPSRLRLWLTSATVGALAVAVLLSVLTVFVYVAVPLFLVLAALGLLRRLRGK